VSLSWGKSWKGSQLKLVLKQRARAQERVIDMTTLFVCLQVTDAAHPPTHAMLLATSSDQLTLSLASLSALTSHSPPLSVTPHISAALQAAGINASIPVDLQPNMPAILALSPPSITLPPSLAPSLNSATSQAASATDATSPIYTVGRHTIVTGTPRLGSGGGDDDRYCQGPGRGAGDQTCTVLDLSGLPDLLQLSPSPSGSTSAPVLYFTQVTLQGLYKRPFADMVDVLGPPPRQMNLSAGTALPIWAVKDATSM
jgi:hypothetical protein